MKFHGRRQIISTAFIAIFSLMLFYASFSASRAYCAAQPTMPVEITDVRLTWVGIQSNVSPKEKGEQSFWKGGKPPTSSEYGVTDMVRGGSTTGNWGKLDVEFTTYRQWEDEIEFVFYILLKVKNEYKMLTGSTTALYTAQGKGHFVVMYVYPNAIARYGGDIQAIGVKAVVNGKIVSVLGKPKATKAWWEDYSPISGGIIDWFYTPMSRSGIDGYELIKTIK